MTVTTTALILQDAEEIAQEKINPPLRYRDNGRAIASVVCLWIGLVGTIASCIILWLYYQHLDTYGPKSHSARMRDEVDKSILKAERVNSGRSARDQATFNSGV